MTLITLCPSSQKYIYINPKTIYNIQIPVAKKKYAKNLSNFKI